MHRIDTATKAADLFGAGKHGYKDGDKANGIPATDLDAATFNALQEEIVGVIEGQGIALVKGNHTQLRQAITQMIQSGQRAVIINNAVFAPSVTGTGKAVYWDSANNRFDLALADGSAKQNMVGFADVANGNVYAFGDAVLFAGLTPGGRYYLDSTTAGAITDTAPPSGVVFVGIARGATEIFVDVDAASGQAPIYGVQGAFKNLTASANGTSANVSVSADEIVVENASNAYKTLRSVSLTINTANSGANGLDTGTLAASTWYAVFVIAKDDGTTAGLMSTSSSAPTMPSGYTYKARVGWIRTDGTGNKYPLGFTQKGRNVSYLVASGSNVTAPPTMASGSAGTWSSGTYTSVAVSVSNYVPPTAAKIAVHINTASAAVIAGITPNNSSTWTGYGGANPPPINNVNGNTMPVVWGSVLLESTNIYWASGGATLMCDGWEDNL